MVESVIVMTAAETQRAIELTIASTGFTLSELREQASIDGFKTEAARRAWVAVKGLV